MFVLLSLACVSLFIMDIMNSFAILTLSTQIISICVAQAFMLQFLVELPRGENKIIWTLNFIFTLDLDLLSIGY